MLVFALALGCATPAAPPPAGAEPRPAPVAPAPPDPTPPAAEPSPAEPSPTAATPEPARPRPCLRTVIGLARKSNIDGPGWPNLARATDLAQQDHDKASAVYDKDPGRAAGHFMDCASRFLAKGIEDRELAQANARGCYMNAVAAYAIANTFATKGRAALEKAAKGDKANAELLREYLANPPDDCGTWSAPRSRRDE